MPYILETPLSLDLLKTHKHMYEKGGWEGRGLKLYPAKTFKNPCDSDGKNN